MKQELVLKEKLPEGWKCVHLLDVANFEKGTEPGSASYSNSEGTRFLRIGEVSGKSDGAIFTNSDKINLVNEKDILMTFDGSPGLVCRGLNGAISSGIRKIYSKDKEILNNDYLFWILQSPIVQKIVEKYTNGAILKHAGSSINHIEILLPPLPVQKQIVAKLDAQMAQIEIMKKEAEKEKWASGEYYESFTNNLIINSKYGTISKISDVCKEDKKQIIATSEEARKRTYIGMEDISSNTGVITINPKNQGEKILSNTFQFDSRHVLYGKLRPYLNKVALPNFEGRCSTELIPLLPKENCKREFLALLLRTQKVIHAAMKNKTGSRMPRADISEVMKVEFKLPSLDEQEKIIEDLLEFSKNYNNLNDIEINRNNAISQLPSSLLNEVFGKYEIPEVN